MSSLPRGTDKIDKHTIDSDVSQEGGYEAGWWVCGILHSVVLESLTLRASFERRFEGSERDC